jgi:hypothetical protein
MLWNEPGAVAAQLHLYREAAESGHDARATGTRVDQSCVSADAFVTTLGDLGRRDQRDRQCPKAAVRAMSARLLLLCLLFREFVANGGGRPWSAPPQCCIAGAGQPKLVA